MTAEFPCCEHCGPPTAGADEGTRFGNGLGHDGPCPACQDRWHTHALLKSFRPERDA